jgi:hypothetical protein
MITPEVAQLIAEERIAEHIRYAETAHLRRLARADRPTAWARATRGLRGGLPALRSRRHAPVAPCATC